MWMGLSSVLSSCDGMLGVSTSGGAGTDGGVNQNGDQWRFAK
jgi:hypothetical protein